MVKARAMTGRHLGYRPCIQAGFVGQPSMCPAKRDHAGPIACMEQLEPRLLFSAPDGLSPADIRQAYGIDSVSFGSIAGTGAGQTIAIVTAYNDPYILADLRAFDRQFNLPDPPKFTVIGQDGTTTLPGPDPDGPGNSWVLETSMDVEWAHAVAPNANILLIEANSSADSDLLAAVDTARKHTGVSVVSMSWSEDEFSGESSEDKHFTTPSGHTGVTFIAPTGDDGAGMAYPAASPNVLAVGGTTLRLSAGGDYISETSWGYGDASLANGGSGGGISRYEKQPAYQHALVTQSSTMRAGPDVAFDADPDSSPVAVYDTWDNGASSPWTLCGGTSLGVPAWAGIIAIANQGRVLAGMGTLYGPTQTLPMIYALPSGDFHDITTGDNGFSAAPGYDLVTGRGTPIVDLLVKGLIPPQAVNDSVAVHDDGSASRLDVLANDEDYNDSAMMITAVGAASHGTVSLSGGQVFYTLDDLSARSDSFTYTISDAYGGVSTATVNLMVQFDNPCLAIGDGQTAKSLTYTDADGTTVTISIAKGTATLLLTGSDLTIPGTTKLTVDGTAELAQVVLSSATLNSSLTITTKGGADGLATVGQISGATPVGSFSAPGINLAGVGVAMTSSGYIRSLTLHDIDADMTMPGTGAAAGVTIVGKLIDASQITLGSPLASLSASQWNSGGLIAPRATTIALVGDKKRFLPGNLGADITLNSASVKGVALGKLSVSGTIDAAVLAQGGSVSSIVAGTWADGSLTARTVKSLTIKGDFDADLFIAGQNPGSVGALGLTSASITGNIGGSTWSIKGAVGSVTVGGAVNGWTMQGLDAADPLTAVKSLVTGDVTSSTIAIDGTIGTLNVKSCSSGDIHARVLTSLIAKGSFASDLSLDGSATPKIKTLGAARVAGAVSGTWAITGLAGALGIGSATTAWNATFTGSVAGLTVQHDLSGQFRALSTKQITIKGNLTAAVVTLTAAVPSARSPSTALGGLSVTGRMVDSTVDSAGNIGAVTVGAMENSQLYAGLAEGWQGMPTGRGDFSAASDDLLPRIKSFTVRGVQGQVFSFASSIIAAWRIGPVKLMNVQADTPGSTDSFGLAANGLASYTRRTGPAASYTWRKAAASGWPADDLGDFRIIHLM